MRCSADKIQKYIFNRLLKEEKVFYETFSTVQIIFSDGVRAFLLPKDQILFNLEKCREVNYLTKQVKSACASSTMKLTNKMCKAANRKIYRMLVSIDGSEELVWIEEDFAKNFEAYSFVYPGGKNPVCVRDHSGEFIAAIMPCDIDGSITRQA